MLRLTSAGGTRKVAEQSFKILREGLEKWFREKACVVLGEELSLLPYPPVNAGLLWWLTWSCSTQEGEQVDLTRLVRVVDSGICERHWLSG